ncbi:Zinc finger protein 431 [Eumeta japonica]|uniref:Zinc finger protein 431 n=1 Tax=Eumeta variegata TaxID=151549 RepID=A0A4C1Y916_EUMVA|nr:Zinc finger protein 431 [Eumeta japonica]
MSTWTYDKNGYKPTALTQTALLTKTEATHCAKVISRVSFVLDEKTTDRHQEALGECADHEGTSVVKKEGGRCACCAGSPDECDCGADVGMAAAGKLYKCEQCEYSTSHRGSLKTHVRTHTGAKPYKCDQCEYSATQLGAKPYKCDQCEYSATQLGTLKRHMRTHSGKKLYICEQCKYSTSHRSNLKTHMRAHTDAKQYSATQLGAKPYKCDQCEYSATQLGTLKRHMRTIVGRNLYM